jgi:hypothetical protein
MKVQASVKKDVSIVILSEGRAGYMFTVKRIENIIKDRVNFNIYKNQWHV